MMTLIFLTLIAVLIIAFRAKEPVLRIKSKVPPCGRN
jgi:hypothetical protein